jgi:glucokinase
LSVAEEAYGGDTLAMKVYQEIGRFIGIALANAVNVIDTEIIILGGSVMKSSDLFMRAVKKNLKEEIISPKLKKIKVVPGKLEQAGAIGAALLTLTP